MNNMSVLLPPPSPVKSVPAPCSCTCPPLLSRCPWSTNALRWRWIPTLKTASEPPGGTSQKEQTQRGSEASVGQTRWKHSDAAQRFTEIFPTGTVSYQVRVQVEGCGQMSSVVLLCRSTVHHKKTHSILKHKVHLQHTRNNNVSCSAKVSDFLVEQIKCGRVADLLQLIGLEDFRDRHREAESLTQVHVLLF